MHVSWNNDVSSYVLRNCIFSLYVRKSFKLMYVYIHQLCSYSYLVQGVILYPNLASIRHKIYIYSKGGSLLKVSCPPTSKIYSQFFVQHRSYTCIPELKKTRYHVLEIGQIWSSITNGVMVRPLAHMCKCWLERFVNIVHCVAIRYTAGFVVVFFYYCSTMTIMWVN